MLEHGETKEAVDFNAPMQTANLYCENGTL